MKFLLLLLLAFFRLHVDDPNPPSDPDPDPEDPQEDLQADPADPDPADPDPQQVTTKEEAEAARQEAKEAKAEAERYQRELTELRAQRAPQPQNDELAREEARLNAADTPELEKWQIRANRELRAGRTAAQTALMQAEDVRDQTAFTQLAVTEPALHKRYASKVEQELTKARGQGYNVKREFIYNQLIAKDMRDGKFKKKAAPAADADKGNKVNRGKLPGARSDVSARSGSMSEHEKRAKRLENVQI